MLSLLLIRMALTLECCFPRHKFHPEILFACGWKITALRVMGKDFDENSSGSTAAGNLILELASSEPGLSRITKSTDTVDMVLLQSVWK